MVHYALPLIPVGLLQMGLHQMDRFMLKALGPVELAMTWTGVYALGYQIGFMVQQMGMGSFMAVWQPSIFGVSDPTERGKLQSRVNTYAMLFVGGASIALIVFGSEIVGFLAGQPDYLAATNVLPWVTAGYVFYGLYALGQVTLLAEKRTWPLLWINASTLAVNLGLDAILIPRMGELGYVGPAIATLVTFALQALLVVWVAHGRVGSAPLEWKRIGAVLALVLIAMGLSLGFEDRVASFGWSRLAIEALKAGVVSAMLAVFWLAILTRVERGAVRERLARLPAVGRLF
jgi:O-antigen/teichoic acid export membrane protein